MKTPLLTASVFVFWLAGCSSLPLSVDALMQQGLDAYQSGDYAESVLSFEQVIEREPGRILAYVYIARSLLAQTRWREAIPYLRQALERAPDNPEALAVLGQSLLAGGRASLQDGQIPAAIGYFLEFLQVQPKSLAGYKGLVQAYLENREFDEAGAAVLRGLVNAQGDTSDLLPSLLQAGQGSLQGGDVEAAIELFGAYIKQNPGNASAFVELAKAHLKQGSVLQALSAARKALQLNPSSAGARSLLQGLNPG